MSRSCMSEKYGISELKMKYIFVHTYMFSGSEVRLTTADVSMNMFTMFLPYLAQRPSDIWTRRRSICVQCAHILLSIIASGSVCI